MLVTIVLLIASLSSPLVLSASLCTNQFGTNKHYGTCQLIDECTGAAFISNCSGSNVVCCVQDQTADLSGVEDSKLDKSLFFKLLANTTRNRAMYSYFVLSMMDADVSTSENYIYRRAAYLAQLVGESDAFRTLESSQSDSDYDPELGNDQPEDGINYRSRGVIRLRGKSNYNYVDKNIQNLNVVLIRNPERLVFPSTAFKVAAWLWKNSPVLNSKQDPVRGDLNQLVDGTFHNFVMLTTAFTNQVDDLINRVKLNDQVLSGLNYTRLKRGEGIACNFGYEAGYALPICPMNFRQAYCGCEGRFDKDSCPYGLDGNKKCRSSYLIKCCVETCRNHLDLVVIMDSSGSIQSNDFQEQKNFVNNFIQSLDLEFNRTRVGLINFSNQVETLFYLNDNLTRGEISRKVYSAKHFQLATQTDLALKEANQNVLVVEKGMRNPVYGVPKAVVIITDGASIDPEQTLSQANRLKHRGFNLIAVGIGPLLNIKGLTDISSSLNDLFLANDFQHTSSILSSLSRQTCRQPVDASNSSTSPITTTAVKNCYKYFKYILAPNSPTVKVVYVFLEAIRGRTELYGSFSEEYPRSNQEYLIYGTEPVQFQFFTFTSIRRFVFNNDDSKRVLYFSVRGLEQENKFRVWVRNDSSSLSFKIWQVILATALIWSHYQLTYY